MTMQMIIWIHHIICHDLVLECKREETCTADGVMAGVLGVTKQTVRARDKMK